MSQAETMSAILPAPGIVLHIWPGRWDLPSFDPLCLATVLYMQVAIPGKFRLVECSNSDSSPTGVLDHCLLPYYKTFTLHQDSYHSCSMINSQFPRSPLSSNIFQGLRMQTRIWTFLLQKEPKELPGMHMLNPTWEIWW
jgi:sorting and assembly machinery component 37